MDFAGDAGQILVHLDLKGAPPRLDYLQKVLPLMKRWGATGLLVEYEDMFPYQADLSLLCTKFAYSKDDVSAFLQMASDNNLTVIPLVQTFGHMEFVLKHSRFRHLREVEQSPMNVCPSNPDSLQLVCAMMDQVIAVHPGIRWFHIGCDEIYHLGTCARCKQRCEQDNLLPQQLFFQHVKTLAVYLRERYPCVTPIVWDDMFRFTDTPLLKESGLGELVEPMVWHYLPSFQMPSDLWERLSAVFPHVWVASAFKGATGTRACVTNVAYHLDNHLTWINTVQSEGHRFKSVRGIAVTGWQRYDHYAVLCELLPQALPSLCICLHVIHKGSFCPELHQSISSDLGFTSPLPLNPFACREVPYCCFPGSVVYQLMIEYAFLAADCAKIVDNDNNLTWMNVFNVRRNFTNPVYVRPILSTATVKLEQVEEFHKKLSAALSDIFFPDTVEEWLGCHLQSHLDKLQHLVQTATQQLAITAETGT